MQYINQQHCQVLDLQDPLTELRANFFLPEGVINMDGNSLGALPKSTVQRMQTAIQDEWGTGLIRSWSTAGWFESPTRIGDKIAPLIGANEGEVLVADTTSVNLFKALAAALSINKDRSIILSETGNFPTDLYMMQGISTFSKGAIQSKVVASEAIISNLSEEVAVLLLTHVHYKTAYIKDMQYLTQKAHEKGVLVVWDLSHSVGSIEVDLNEAKADFAVGCGYKFLNGGPGAPAFIFVAKRHQLQANCVLSGWMGHQDPFAFTDEYVPANSIERFRCGTPVMLGMIALENGVDVFRQTSITALRKKAIQLSELFITLMTQECSSYGFTLASPADAKKRAGHVAFQHQEGHAIYQAIKRKDIISDFRVPDVLRFGVTPMYTRFEDIYQVVMAIKEVMETKAWDRAEYQVRAAIT